jgi:hypothetical protein
LKWKKFHSITKNERVFETISFLLNLKHIDLEELLDWSELREPKRDTEGKRRTSMESKDLIKREEIYSRLMYKTLEREYSQEEWSYHYQPMNL